METERDGDHDSRVARPSGAPTTDERSDTQSGSGAFVEDMRRPEAYGAPSGAPVELIETHVSRVFLVGSEVYKTKKPVYLGFLDFRTPELRRAACEAEVALNRRLAPGIYKGVVPVRRGRDGRYGTAGDGDIVDWAVSMVRLPDARRADVMLARGELSAAHIEQIASRVARFHEEARRDDETARFGRPEAIAVNVRENFEQTRGSVGAYISRDEAAEIEREQLSFLSREAALFEARIQAGRVRDGHGDLRLEHVYLDDKEGVRVIDCIEFNDRFRYADTCSDVAFLSMDLAWHGRVDLAELWLAAYAREADDFDMLPLVDFYEGYRAYVRGKVATILASDASAPGEARARASAEARRYFLLALAASRAPLVPPQVIAVGGVIASGKSTVAKAVAAEIGAPIVEADRTRKSMLGVAHTTRLTDPSWSGAYDRRFTEDVYQELLRRASKALDAGRPVVLDASFRSASMRRQARELAQRYGVPFLLIECRADRDVCIERLRRREREASVSDGRIEIFDDFCAQFEAINELRPGEHLVVDTSGDINATMDRIRREGGATLRGPGGLVT